MKSIRLVLAGVVLLAAAAFASAFELKPDGSMALLPQEVAVLEQCKAQGGKGCFIVNRDVVERFAQAYAEAQLAEFQAEVQEKFEAAVLAKAKELAKQIAKNSL